MSGSNGIFNVAKGRIAYYGSLPAASDSLVVVLLKSSGLQADSALGDHDTLAAVLAANTECDFTNYARQALSGVVVAVDDTNEWVTVDADDVVFASAGGASNNTVAKLLVCYKPDAGSADSDVIPFSYHTYDVTTTGATLNVAFAAGGFAKAA